MNEDKDLWGNALARPRDPDTSHEAAESMAGAPAGILEKLVEDIVRGVAGGLICSEIVAVSGQEWNTISPRMKPMRGKGLIHDSGERRVNPATGRRQMVLKIGPDPARRSDNQRQKDERELLKLRTLVRKASTRIYALERKLGAGAA